MGEKWPRTILRLNVKKKPKNILGTMWINLKEVIGILTYRQKTTALYNRIMKSLIFIFQEATDNFGYSGIYSN